MGIRSFYHIALLICTNEKVYNQEEGTGTLEEQRLSDKVMAALISPHNFSFGHRRELIGRIHSTSFNQREETPLCM